MSPCHFEYANLPFIPKNFEDEDTDKQKTKQQEDLSSRPLVSNAIVMEVDVEAVSVIPSIHEENMLVEHFTGEKLIESNFRRMDDLVLAMETYLTIHSSCSANKKIDFNSHLGSIWIAIIFVIYPKFTLGTITCPSRHQLESMIFRNSRFGGICDLRSQQGILSAKPPWEPLECQVP